MLIVERRELADGEIEFAFEAGPWAGSAARANAEFCRLQRDARMLDGVLGDASLDLCGEWVAVFDGEIFRAAGLDDLLAQFEAHGVNPGRAVKHYVYDRAAAEG
jgi:hypothetical protein